MTKNIRCSIRCHVTAEGNTVDNLVHFSRSLIGCKVSRDMSLVFVSEGEGGAFDDFRVYSVDYIRSRDRLFLTLTCKSSGHATNICLLMIQ